MPSMGERAYVYAKACGIIGKSFIGNSIPRLKSIAQLSELDKLVFPESYRDLPERELLVDLERRVISRSANQIKTIVNAYKKPPELLIRLLRSYEYSDLENALSALSGGESKCPPFTALDRFQTIHFEAYPDLKAMVAGTEFEFILQDTEPEGIQVKIKLDQQYYAALWDSLARLSPKDRQGIDRIIEEEIALRNIAWTLRFRTYYNMDAEDIRAALMLLPGLKPHKGKAPSLGEDAIAALELPLDTYSAWERWSRIKFLNQERAGEAWRADPRYFQNSASEYLYHLARHYFRRRPFSINSAACFIKLKQFEEDLLTSIVEGLGLGIASRDIFALLEVEP